MPKKWPPLQLVPPGEPQAERLEDLLGEVARGNRAAFDSLYTRIGGPVFGLVHRMLRDAAQAEEVAQEACCRCGARRAASTTAGAARSAG